MSDSEIITYEKLYEILRMEKFRTDLQKVPSDFLDSVRNYLSEKTKIIEKQKAKETSMFQAEVMATQRQLENVKRILNEIYDRRESKILQAAVFASRSGGKPIPNLLSHEKDLYDSLLEVLSSFRAGVLINLLQNKSVEKPKPKSIKTENKEISTCMLRFTDAIPRFVAENLKSYGPFEAEDVAVVPKLASDVLIKNNKAELITENEKT